MTKEEIMHFMQIQMLKDVARNQGRGHLFDQEGEREELTLDDIKILDTIKQMESRSTDSDRAINDVDQIIEDVDTSLISEKYDQGRAEDFDDMIQEIRDSKGSRDIEHTVGYQGESDTFPADLEFEAKQKSENQERESAQQREIREMLSTEDGRRMFNQR